MNRDGYRGSPELAEHLAAHVVVAALSGWVIFRLSITPSRGERADSVLGSADVHAPRRGIPCPVSLSATAEFDVAAAGVAWDELAASDGGAWDWQWCADIDRGKFGPMRFLAAVARVQQMLRRPEVAAAVRDLAATVQARKGGEIFDTTMSRIIGRHVPKYGAGCEEIANDLAIWLHTTPRDPSLPPVKWTPPKSKGKGSTSTEGGAQ
jgi:hypothetical protein